LLYSVTYQINLQPRTNPDFEPRTKLGIIMNAEREPIEKSYPRLFDTMAEILFRHDPLGINFEHNTDEYPPEVGTILPRLESATS